MENLYLDKSTTITDQEKRQFVRVLGQFQKAVEIEESGHKIILPQLRSVYLILSFFKAWKEITEDYAVPKEFSFTEIVREFESQRTKNQDELPWLSFTSALSNAGYAKNRINSRHQILMSFIFRKYPSISLKDRKRSFTEEQKIAIWDRAEMQCEWIENNERCKERFDNFREADADHIIKWNEGGPTSIENGRLLCRKHNRSRR